MFSRKTLFNSTSISRNSPAAAGLRLLHQAAFDFLPLLFEPGIDCICPCCLIALVQVACCLNLVGFIAFVHRTKSHLSGHHIMLKKGVNAIHHDITWCNVAKRQTSPSRSSTFSASPSVAAVLGWKEACVCKDTFVCLKILWVINFKSLISVN